MPKRCNCGQDAVWNVKFWSKPSRPNVKPKRLQAPVCGAHALAIDMTWNRDDYRLETL